MRHALAFLAGLLLAAACTFQPSGQCSTAADCFPGLSCLDGICLGCQSPAECQAWETCGGDHRCTLQAGRCVLDRHCGSWQQCDGEHVCRPRPGTCDGAADCAEWETCTAHACVVQAGRCVDDGQCAAWQQCDAGHLCAVRPGSCDETAGCAEWESCQSHACLPLAGRCTLDQHCAAWQQCDAGHLCVLRPGSCDETVGCAEWESCQSHACLPLAGRCTLDQHCAAWQQCDAGHQCVLRPGSCEGAVDCAEWETCQSHACVVQAGRCTLDQHCAGYETCGADHVCAVAPLDDQQVALWGTITPGGCGGEGVAPLSAPTQVRLGLYCYDSRPARVSPGGAFVYTYRGYQQAEREVRAFRPDAPVWQERTRTWALPTDVYANDEILVPARPCPGGAPYGSWVLQAGTGRILHSCTDAEVRTNWYDEAGQSVVSDAGIIMAWTEGGAMYSNPNLGNGGMVISPSGVRTRVTGLPSTGQWMDLVRSHGEGFHLVWGYDGAPVVRELWRVDAVTAVASLVGTYAELPPEINFEQAIDGAGALYVTGFRASDFVQIAMRVPLAPELPTVAYSEASAPVGANDLGKNPLKAFLLLHGNSQWLVSGP